MKWVFLNHEFSVKLQYRSTGVLTLAQHISFLKNLTNFAYNKRKQGLYEKQDQDDPSTPMEFYAQIC